MKKPYLNQLQRKNIYEYSMYGIYCFLKLKTVKLIVGLKRKLQSIRKWINKILTSIKHFIVDTWGWIRSLWIYSFRRIKKPAIFFGHSAYWFARHYAQRRDKRWKMGWDQSGKRQGIIPFDDTRIIVCSRMELKNFQTNGMIKNVVSINGLFKKSSYYKSDLNYKSKTRK